MAGRGRGVGGWGGGRKGGREEMTIVAREIAAPLVITHARSGDCAAAVASPCDCVYLSLQTVTLVDKNA